jgi:hypothetical protein
MQPKDCNTATLLPCCHAARRAPIACWWLHASSLPGWAGWWVGALTRIVALLATPGAVQNKAGSNAEQRLAVKCAGAINNDTTTASKLWAALVPIDTISQALIRKSQAERTNNAAAPPAHAHCASDTLR